MRKVYWLLCLLLLLSAASCKKKTFLPKPVGYHKIELPKNDYQLLDVDSLPFRLDYSKYANVIADTSWITERFWMDFVYEGMKANIQFSYKSIDNDVAKLREYIIDSYKLTSKHQIKAYAIEESIMKTPDGKTVIAAELEGEVPSQFQLFTTDSTNHFVRAALYFPTATKNDSLAPIIDFVKRDMMHMFNTLTWTK